MMFDRFLEEFAHDLDQGRVRSLEEYQERYPDAADSIAQEYEFYVHSHAAKVARDPGVAMPHDPLSAPRAAAPLPEAVGRYRILGLLDRGGMGAIYRAHDPELDREVVLKTLLTHLIGSPVALARLRREARLAGQLDHPSLCPVLDVVPDGDRLYVVLPFIDGKTLERHLADVSKAGLGSEALWLGLAGDSADESSTARVRAQMNRQGIRGLPFVLQVCERTARAVHIAHEAGIVHRDLKPANIIVQPDGIPVVLDFGLATQVDGTSSLTVPGQVLGTPSYMAPEQVNAHPDQIDRRTDVHALGVILYELLTLVRPYRGQSPEVVFDGIRRGDPVPLRKHDPAIPRDVEAVCLKAMALEPDHRYPTAQALADDLANLLQLRPTSAKPLGTASRWLRRARRHPAVAALTAVTVLSLAALLGTWIHRLQTARERSQINAAAVTIREALRRSERPPTDAVRLLAATLPEGESSAFLSDPQDPIAYQRLVGYLLENLRSTDESELGIRLVSPRGGVVQGAVRFSARCELPRDRLWHFVASLENPDTAQVLEHRFARRVDSDGLLTFRIDEAQAPMPGLWRWILRIDPAEHPGESMPAGHGQFLVVASADLARMLRRLPLTGDDLLDRHLEATALLSPQHQLADLALDRLGMPLSDIQDPIDRARHLLLQMRAQAILGQRERVLELSREWGRLRDERHPSKPQPETGR